MIKKKYLSYMILAYLLFAFTAKAQNSSCAQILKQAQKNYDQGQLEDIQPLLTNCMSSGFSKNEKISAYRLIILTNLFMDEQGVAEQNMKLLLTLDPDYVPNPSLDPVEYINLFKSFNTLPVVSFGAFLGLNNTSVRVVNHYSTYNTLQYAPRLTAGNAFQFALSAEWLLKPFLYLSSDLVVNLKSFASSNKAYFLSEVNAAESQTNLELPIAFKILFLNTKKIRPFIRLGVATSFMLTASAKLVRKNIESNQDVFVGPEINTIINQRNVLNMGLLSGAGLNYKIGYGYLSLEARYIYGLSNQVNPDTRYNYFESQLTNYGYIDSDMALNHIQISAGYYLSIYKVKKNNLKKNASL